MSDLTLSQVKTSIAINVAEAIQCCELKFDASCDSSDISDIICDSIRDNMSHYEISYTHEAIDICLGSEFPSAECVDYEGITSASDALMREACAIISELEDECINESIHEVSERFEEICETADSLGFEGELTVSSGDNCGWNSHDYETSEGTCVHKNLEGERGLTAVVGEINGLYLSCCFTVEA